MNLFNRLLAILVAGCLLLAGLLGLAGVSGLADGPEVEQAGHLLGLANAADALRHLPGVGSLWVGVGAAGLTLLGLALLALEVRPARRGPELLLQRDRGGVVSVSLHGLRRLADHVVAGVPGVETVVSEARPTRKGLDFSCRIVLLPESSAPDVADTIRARLDAAVRQHTGLPASRIDVHTRVDGAAITRKRVR
jgi:hypothetical protein